VHIPYRGTGPQLQDLLAGRTETASAGTPALLPHIKSGKLRALAITTAKRYPMLPDLPTMAEAGVVGYESTAWFGIVAPARTPAQIVNRLNSEVNRILKLPDVMERLTQQGAEPGPRTSQEFGAFIKAEIAKWGKVVKASGAKLD